MKPIAPFTPAEQRAVAAASIFRYGHIVELQDADVDLKLDPARDELTACPAKYWNEHGVQFVVCKTADTRYRSYFFYTDHEQFRIGERDYDAIEDCVRNLLQLQTDHERIGRGVFSGATGADLPDDYDGPIII